MKHTPLTEKQAKAQIRLGLFQSILGLCWLVMGFVDKDWPYIILGLLFLAIQGGSVIYTLWVRKHFPIDDPKADQILEENQKAGKTGFFIVFGIITLGFLIASGIAYALK